MDRVNLKLLAEAINIPINQLIEKLSEIGIVKTKLDFITDDEKVILLKKLNINTKINLNTFILQRKKHSTLNISTANGKHKIIPVEVRKKHVYLKNKIEDSININSHTNKLYENDNLILNTKKQEINSLAQCMQKVNGSLNKKNKFSFKNSIKNESNHVSVNNSVKESKIKDKKRRSEIFSRSIVEKKEKLHDKLKNWVMENNNKKEFVSKKKCFVNVLEENKHDNLEKKYRENIYKNKIHKQQKKNNNFVLSKIDQEDKNYLIKYSKKNNKNCLLLQQRFQKPVKNINRNIVIGETITVSELAKKMAVKTNEIIKTMNIIGGVATSDQILEQDMAQLIAEEMGHKVTIYCENKLEQTVMKDRKQGLMHQVNRAPIVTVMGHVDHGKTSLLDYIRSTNVVSKESGGITQHIGAYHVKTKNGIITFLDTPGHSAFTAMRARGVHATDIVVLVVAADDGVKPQTIEAIQHAQAAKVPVIVAINKIDKKESDTEIIKNQLTKYGIVPENWGGENIFVHISAKTGEGINDLLHSILLQAELLELYSSSDGMASGVVIESSLDKRRGPIATVLVKEGKLSKGNIVLCGCEYGRVRALLDEKGKDVTTAGPSIPVQILGLSGVPNAGNVMTVVRNEKQAREVAIYRKNQFRASKISIQRTANIENMFSNIITKHNTELNIIIKTDVQGSLEAISDSLLNISNKEILIKIVSSGVGGITETDVLLASASKAIILGFNVRADNTARKMVILENIDLRYYSVIYNLISEVKELMSGMLEPKYKHEIIGLAEVRNIFKSPKFGDVAGCMVIEGIIKKNKPIRILRNHIVLYEGELESLRRFKDDVNEVRNGLECGIGVKNYNDIRINDIIEVSNTISIKRII
ncbi:translation initiation factor IF-2 [Buchnera aphidicola]|uniref:translation initiation factor IF-2 n=1 Tax=Buchnera aphidicola TaxID=9 RepID=UPI003464D79C